MATYTEKLAKLRARRNAPEIQSKSLHEVISRLGTQNESTKYVVQAMQPVEPEYTENTRAECKRVENQLANGYKSRGIPFDFRHQGSVTNNTHIKAHSDIDLLSIHDGFYTLQKPQVPTSPYKGIPDDDLIGMRQAAVEILTAAFPEADIDNTGDKCLTISGGSLRRNIDVVPSNWFNSNEYAKSEDETIRGIMVYSRELKERVKNYPFYHNFQIETKDRATLGNLRKAIRLLKSVKYDSDMDIQLSSFDIAGICWNMEPERLIAPQFAEVLLVRNCDAYVTYLLNNQGIRTSIDTPDGMRKVFDKDAAKVPELKKLSQELQTLVRDVETGALRSFAKLEEARYPY